MQYDHDEEKRKAYEAGRAGSPHAASPETQEAYQRGLQEHRDAAIAGAGRVADEFLAKTGGMGCLQALSITVVRALFGFLAYPLTVLASLFVGLLAGILVKSIWDNPWGLVLVVAGGVATFWYGKRLERRFISGLGKANVVYTVSRLAAVAASALLVTAWIMGLDEEGERAGLFEPVGLVVAGVAVLLSLLFLRRQTSS